MSGGGSKGFSAAGNLAQNSLGEITTLYLDFFFGVSIQRPKRERLTTSKCSFFNSGVSLLKDTNIFRATESMIAYWICLGSRNSFEERVTSMPELATQE